MNSPLIITLVHGTWGKSSHFTRPNSPLRRAIRDLPNTKIGFLRFTWNGANGNLSRLKASMKLADFLSAAILKYPDHKHIVIAHSHGGNVLLHALEDDALACKIAGIITVGTPFLIAHEAGPGPQLMNRLITDALRNPTRSLPIIAAGLLGLIFYLLDSQSSFLKPLHFLDFSSSLVFFGCLLAITGVFWLLMFVLQRQFRASVLWSNLIQTAQNRRKMLCLFVEWDEPGVWLALLSGVRTAIEIGHAVTITLLFAIASLCGLITFLVSVPLWLIRELERLGLFKEVFEKSEDWILDHGHPFILGFYLSVLAMALISIVLTFLDLLFFATPAGFGLAEWRHGWFVKQTSRLEPPSGFHAQVVRYRTKELAREFGWIRTLTTLRHSILFRSRGSLEEIRAFIAKCDLQ